MSTHERDDEVHIVKRFRFSLTGPTHRCETCGFEGTILEAADHTNDGEPVIPQNAENVEKPCPDCRIPMHWVDDKAGYYCKWCLTHWCVQRAIGTITNGVWRKDKTNE